MYLHCCHRRIPVHLGHDLRDEHGRPAKGIFRREDCRIFLDSSLPRAERRETLVHELGHAFDAIAGRIAGDDESRQDRAAAIEAAFAMSLEEQGGEQAIHALYGDSESEADGDGEVLGGPVTVTDDSEADWPTRLSCPSCHQSHASDRARNGTPALDIRRNVFVMWRVLTCRECGREFRWLQQCTPEGLPVPNVIVQPKVRILSLVD